MSNSQEQQLHRELSSAAVIKEQLTAITDDFQRKYKDEGARQFAELAHASTDEALDGMLSAKTMDNFLLHEKRLSNLLKNLKKKSNLPDNLEDSLASYRFYRHLMSVLGALRLENAEPLLKHQPQWFIEDLQYQEWEPRLNQLAKLKNENELEVLKSKFFEEILKKDSGMDLANLASLAVMERQIRAFSKQRMAELKQSKKWQHFLQDAGWMGLGLGLVITSSVFGIAFPFLAIPGLVLGAAVVGYSVIDFIKQSREVYSELYPEDKGSHITQEFIEQLKKEYGESLPGINIEALVKQQMTSDRKWSLEKKLVTGLGYGSSAAGLGLAMLSMAFLFPGFTVPLGVIIAVSVAALVITSFSGVLLGFKVYRENAEYKNREREIKELITEDTQSLAELPLLPQDQFEPSSTARLFQKGIATHVENGESALTDEGHDKIQEREKTPETGNGNAPEIKDEGESEGETQRPH